MPLYLSVCLSVYLSYKGKLNTHTGETCHAHLSPTSTVLNYFCILRHCCFWELWFTSDLCPAVLRNPDPGQGEAELEERQSLREQGCGTETTATKKFGLCFPYYQFIPKETTVDYDGNIPLLKEVKCSSVE